VALVGIGTVGVGVGLEGVAVGETTGVEVGFEAGEVGLSILRQAVVKAIVMNNPRKNR
jgi:hypothetical protein